MWHLQLLLEGLLGQCCALLNELHTAVKRASMAAAGEIVIIWHAQHDHA
jgi:hypothetical protein